MSWYKQQCTGCRFQGTMGGCIKYSLTTADINKGFWITNSTGASYLMNKEKPCVRKEMRR